MPKSVLTDAYRSLVDLLLAARKEQGVTQVELAARLGRKQPFVSMIEMAQRRVDVIEFCAIAKALDIDPVALFQRVTAVLPDELDIS